jgi:hypothetical protein
VRRLSSDKAKYIQSLQFQDLPQERPEKKRLIFSRVMTAQLSNARTWRTFRAWRTTWKELWQALGRSFLFMITTASPPSPQSFSLIHLLKIQYLKPIAQPDQIDWTTMPSFVPPSKDAVRSTPSRTSPHPPGPLELCKQAQLSVPRLHFLHLRRPLPHLFPCLKFPPRRALHLLKGLSRHGSATRAPPPANTPSPATSPAPLSSPRR